MPKIYLFLILLMTHYSANSVAADMTPLPVNANLPIMIGSGLPEPMPATLASSSGEFKWQLNFQSNANDSGSLNHSTNQNEQLLIDAETIELNFAYAKSFNNGLEANAAISVYRHSAGRFDNIIDRWHTAFDLDDGDRRLFEQNKINLRYAIGNQQRSITARQTGIGDLHLGLGYQLIDHSTLSATLRGGVNIPTGSQRKLTGSEKVDIDVGLYLASPALANHHRLAWHANLGVVIIGDTELFTIPTRSSMLFTSVGLHWSAMDKLDLHIQLDSHGSVFDSTIPELSSTAMALSLGVTFLKTAKSEWRMFFSEDIKVNRSADFSFGLSRSIRF